jgi:ribosomal protein S18 acetylase RimI-like enzyme
VGDTDLAVEPLAGGASDLVALAQCHALYASVFPAGSPPRVVAGAEPAVWVARIAGAVAGFVAGGVATERGGVFEVTSIAVDAAHRGTGIGRALLRVVIANARERGLRGVLLHVSTGNGPALELYTSEGFRATRRLVGFYTHPTFPDGGDAWEMLLRFG